MIGRYKRIKFGTDKESQVRIEDNNLIIPVVIPITEKFFDISEILVNGDLIRQLCCSVTTHNNCEICGQPTEDAQYHICDKCKTKLRDLMYHDVTFKYAD